VTIDHNYALPPGTRKLDYVTMMAIAAK